MFDYLTYNNILNLFRIVLDIACIWLVVYYTLRIIKNNSRTVQIFKGIIFILIVRGFATFFGLKTLEWLSSMFINWGPLALIIIFQPEIRSILEKMGKTSIFSRISTLTVNERENLVNELVKCCVELSNDKIGALISIEQGISLSDFIKTGVPLNSVVSSELLVSIFAPGTPLHDGAVILQGDKIACASAYFPPTTIDCPTSYGARHRAAIGISEISDCSTIVVSEETGTISVVEAGQMTAMDTDSLREYLLGIICQTTSEVEAVSDIIDQTNHQELLDEKAENKKSRFNNPEKLSSKFKKSKLKEIKQESLDLDNEEKEIKVKEKKEPAIRFSFLKDKKISRVDAENVKVEELSKKAKDFVENYNSEDDKEEAEVTYKGDEDSKGKGEK